MTDYFGFRRGFPGSEKVEFAGFHYESDGFSGCFAVLKGDILACNAGQYTFQFGLVGRMGYLLQFSAI
jgi:hypothetical protein